MLPLILLAALAAEFVELHGLEGHIFVNPAMISSLREPRGEEKNHVPRGTRCVVQMANGRIVAVVDTCDAVRAMLGGTEP